MRPLLYVDIDGPLNPWEVKFGEKPPEWRDWREVAVTIDGTTVFPWVSKNQGNAMTELVEATGMEFRWATMWEDQAYNFAHEWGFGHPHHGGYLRFGYIYQDNITYKLDKILEDAAGRPFVWVDDHIYADADAKVADKNCLLLRIDPAQGVGQADIDLIKAWVEALRTGITKERSAGSRTDGTDAEQPDAKPSTPKSGPEPRRRHSQLTGPRPSISRMATTAANKPAAPPKKSAPKRVVSDSHKKAMASGREAASAVNSYLKALEAQKPKRGRKVSIDDLQRRLVAAAEDAGRATGTAKLLAIQAVHDLEQRIQELASDAGDNIEDLEVKFLQHAESFSKSKGISYASWRKIGVSAELLAKAGIPRTRS